MKLCIDGRVALTDKVILPAVVRRKLVTYLKCQKLVSVAEQRVAVSSLDIVEALTKGKLCLSTRDAGELLGVSHQRIQQLRQQARDEPHRHR